MAEIDINNIRRLDGGLLLVFREVLRHRRTTDAAKRLGITQSTVSHALDRLRDLFGDPLFVRRPHGLEPTRRALELGPRIEALIELASQALEREGGFEPGRCERRFNIAAPENITALISAPLLQSLRQSAPRASFAVQFQLARGSLDALRRGEVDVALGRFGAIPAGFEAEALYEDRYCVVARRGHPTIQGSIDLKTFMEIGHITVADAPEGGPEEPAPDPGLIATVAIVPKWLTALLMVASTDAIASCPTRLGERMAGLLNLQVLEAPFDLAPFTISSVRRAGRPDPGLDWFAQQVRAAVG
jgi:DNA-binding transcriptional LysR family regulator